jgi:hypothetical protein
MTGLKQLRSTKMGAREDIPLLTAEGFGASKQNASDREGIQIGFGCGFD